jgi:Saxitoxin biosynthesis operon protein SxtJ
MQKDVIIRDLRFFGLIVGGIFGIIGMWPTVLRSLDPRWWAITLSGLLIIPALAVPKVLLPAFRGWMAIGQILGWINTRLILGALFYTIFLLFAVILRLLGKDSMHRGFEPDAKTYRVPRQSRPATHMKHQF